jgi:hypothetical protein
MNSFGAGQLHFHGQFVAEARCFSLLPNDHHNNNNDNNNNNSKPATYSVITRFSSTRTEQRD